MKNKILLSIGIIMIINLIALIGMFLYFQYTINKKEQKIQEEIEKISNYINKNINKQKRNNIFPNESLKKKFKKDNFFSDNIFNKDIFKNDNNIFDTENIKIPENNRISIKSGTYNINGNRIKYQIEIKGNNLSGTIQANNKNLLKKIKNKLKNNGINTKSKKNKLIIKGEGKDENKILNILENIDINKNNAF